MKTQKKIFLVLFLALALIVPQYSNALALSQEAEAETTTKTVTEAPPTSTPTCNLEGTVRTIQKNTSKPDYYDVSIEVSGINISEATAADACSSAYGAQIEKAGQILRAADFLQQAIQEGDAITAKVEFTSDETMTGYFLSNIQIINPTEKVPEQKDQTAAITTDTDSTPQKKDDFTKTLIGAFSVITLFILAGMIYSTRDKKKNNL